MKRNLVLLHGWGVNSRVWDSLLPRLSESFSVTPIDLPGYGASSHEQTGNDLDQLAEHVLQRAPDRALWCGWSLGGMVAIAAAMAYPKRIDRLSLVCTTPRFMLDDGWACGSTETAIGNLSDQFKNNYAKALARFFLLQFGTADDARSQSKRLTATVLEEAKPAWQSLEQGLNLLRSVDLREQVSRITVPTEVIVGTNDRVIPADAGRFLANRIPNATLIEADAGHLPFLTNPDWFLNQLEALAGVK